MTATTARLTVIIPCYNEEKNLPATVPEITGALQGAAIADYEILIFNDCSKDKTGAVADAFARQNPRIKVVHNNPNRGFGYNYCKGVELASAPYIVMIPGDNEHVSASLAEMFKLIGKADIIIPHVTNTEVRPPIRRIISRLFTFCINTLFDLHLRYFNGPCVHKKDLLLSVPLQTFDFAYMAVTLVRLIRRGASYLEVGTQLRPRVDGLTSAFRIKNIVSVIHSILSLFWEVRVQRRWEPQSREADHVR